MVDFQSRDTRRGPTSDEESEKKTETDDRDEPESDESGEAADVTEEKEERETDGTALSYAVVRVTAEGMVADDDAGDEVVARLEQADQTVATRDLVQPSYDGLQNAAVTLTDRGDVDAVVFVGGTGVEPSDLTVDALGPLLDKELSGFGELFRRYAAEAVGTSVVGSRTTAGIADGVPVFLVPGSPEAAVLAVEELVIPEAPTLAADAREA